MDFTDPLRGPVSPNLQIPFEKYALSPAGLVRTASDSGTENGIDRPVVKTVSGNYLSRDVVFEVDVTIPADHGDIAFVGFGSGQSHPESSNEPTRAFVFRIHSLPKLPFYAVDIALAEPNAGGSGLTKQFRMFERLADYTPGRAMRFKIEHRAGSVTMSIPEIQKATITFTPEQYRGVFSGDQAFLFFANSSKGTTFANLSVRTP